MQNKVISATNKKALNLLEKGLGNQGVIFHFTESKEK